MVIIVFIIVVVVVVVVFVVVVVVLGDVFLVVVVIAGGLWQTELLVLRNPGSCGSHHADPLFSLVRPTSSSPLIGWDNLDCFRLAK